MRGSIRRAAVAAGAAVVVLGLPAGVGAAAAGTGPAVLGRLVQELAAVLLGERGRGEVVHGTAPVGGGRLALKERKRCPTH